MKVPVPAESLGGKKQQQKNKKETRSSSPSSRPRNAADPTFRKQRSFFTLQTRRAFWFTIRPFQDATEICGCCGPLPRRSYREPPRTRAYAPSMLCATCRPLLDEDARIQPARETRREVFTYSREDPCKLKPSFGPWGAHEAGTSSGRWVLVQQQGCRRRTCCEWYPGRMER